MLSRDARYIFLALCRASMRTSEVVDYSVNVFFFVLSETYVLNLRTSRSNGPEANSQSFNFR